MAPRAASSPPAFRASLRPGSRSAGRALMRGLLWQRLEGRRNPGWEQRLAGFRACARLPREELRAWQARAVAEHLAWARAAVPFHRQRLSASPRLEDAPILTRSLLQEHLDQLVCESLPPAQRLYDASGGSTGAPVRVVHDAAYRTATFASEVWLLEQWGLRPWERTAYLWGDDRAARAVPWKERLARRLLGRRHLNAFALDEARLAAFADELERFRPVVVQGYAGALDLFAGHLRRTGRRLPPPRLVRSAAETLRPEARARIEAALGAPVRDVYGSRESAGLAAQCLHGGFHVLEHAKVLEVLDDDGRAAPPGRPGRVLVTDLANRALGLIRYANGDVAAWAPDDPPCPCGSAYRRLLRVHGRTSDFLTAPSGERIHGEWFTHLLYGHDGVRAFQVHQQSLALVTLRTVGPADEAALAGVLEAMRARLGPRVTVRWERVEEIPPTPSGKHRFTLSDVPWRPEERA